MPDTDTSELILGDPVPRDEPFIVPASPEETYDSIWIRSINIYAPNTAEEDPTGGSLSLEMLPYDGVAKKVLITADNEGVEYLNVPARENGRKPFWSCVDEVPEVKAAMDAILAAIPALQTWVNTPEPPPEPPPIEPIEPPIETPAEPIETPE
jgi:hypothetical protein